MGRPAPPSSLASRLSPRHAQLLDAGPATDGMRIVGVDAGATSIAATRVPFENVAGAAPTRGVVPDHVTR